MSTWRRVIAAFLLGAGLFLTVPIYGQDLNTLLVNFITDLRNGTFTVGGGAGTPVILTSDGSDSLAQRNGATAQQFCVYNTFTSATNQEKVCIDYKATADTPLIGSRTGSAGGSARVVGFIAQGASAGGLAGVRANRAAAPFVRLGIFGTTALSSVDSSGATGNMVEVGYGTNTATSGSVVGAAVVPTYNQASGTADNKDFIINRTQTAIGSGAQYAFETQIAGTAQFSISSLGTLALRNKCTVTVDGATTFALSNTAGCSYIDLQCTGAETINTITGAVTGTLLWLLNGDTDCTIADDDVATAANAIDLTGTGTNDVGAVAKVVGLIYDGANWMQLFESDN